MRGGGANPSARPRRESARGRHTGGYLQWEGEGAEGRRAGLHCILVHNSRGSRRHEGRPVTRIKPVGLHETKKKAGTCYRTVAPHS